MLGPERVSCTHFTDAAAAAVLHSRVFLALTHLLKKKLKKKQKTKSTSLHTKDTERPTAISVNPGVSKGQAKVVLSKGASPRPCTTTPPFNQQQQQRPNYYF